MIDVQLGLLAPHIIVAVTGALVLAADLVSPRQNAEDGTPVLAYLAVAGLTAAAAVSIATAGTSGELFAGALVADPLATFFDLLFIGIGIAVLLLSVDTLPRITRWSAEFYALVVWCTLGNMLLAMTAELFTLFVVLQLTSLPLVSLIAFGKRDALAREAALKYLVIVLISTSILLYGISLVYGAFRTSEMRTISAAISANGVPPLAALGLMLMLAGFGFKATAAPFQQWVPDVYEGAPTPVAALLSVGSKLAGFALALRFVVTGLGASDSLHAALAVLAVASMLIGNLGALQQSNIKRLLAYSGIAQAGYILVGMAAMSERGTSATLFYLAAYGIANLLAFGVVIGFAHATGSERISDYAGLARRSPGAALSITVALLSLAGLPLTVGFMAKFYVFLSAAQEGLYWLVLVAVANTVMAFYYYLRIVWALWVEENDEAQFAIPPRLAPVLAGCSLGVIAIGVFPGPLLSAATYAARALFGA